MVTEFVVPLAYGTLHVACFSVGVRGSKLRAASRREVLSDIA
ncbi:hypothetical protein [Nostoc sp. C110]